MTETQKQIYNLYLKAYRVNNGQPFRPKKHFKDIENDLEVCAQLEKLDGVFKKYPTFFNSTFFDAPYKIYPDDKKYFSLKFYSSQKGITTCIAYYKTLIMADPETQFEFFKQSFKFIAEFCIEKSLELTDYVAYCTISQNDCLKHLKEHKISWYVVFTIPGFYDLLRKMPEDEFELYYGSDIDIDTLYDRYSLSIKTRKYLADITKMIKIYIKRSLKNT